MANEFSFRAAKRADLPAVARIIAENYQKEYTGILDSRYLAGMDEEYLQRIFEAYWLTPGNEIIVASEKGEDGTEAIVGFAAGTPSPDVLGSFWLEYLHVDGEHRRQGIGSALFDEATDMARWMGYDQLTSHIFAGNRIREAFFEKLGGEPGEEFRMELEGFGVMTRIYLFELA